MLMVTTRLGLSSLSLLQVTTAVEAVHKVVVWVFFIKQCSPDTQFSLSAIQHSQIAVCPLLAMTVVRAQNPFSGRDKTLLGLSVTWAHTPSSDLYAPPHGATEIAHILLCSPPKVTENWDGLGNCCSHLLPIIHHNLVSHYYHRLLEEASHSTKSEGHKWAQSLCVAYVPKLWGEIDKLIQELTCSLALQGQDQCGCVEHANQQISSLGLSWECSFIVDIHIYYRFSWSSSYVLRKEKVSHCKHYFSMSLMMTNLDPAFSLVLSLYELRVRALNIVRPFQQPSCGTARERTCP